MDISPKCLLSDLAMLSESLGLLRPLNIFSLFLFILNKVIVAGAQGFEPQLPGPKPGVLPLYYAPNFAILAYGSLGLQ